MKCPTCNAEIPGLARHCKVCDAYVEDMAAVASCTSYTLTLPLPPNKGNARHAHWSVEHRQRVDYLKSCDEWVPADPRVKLAKAHADFRLFVHQLMDSDNLTARIKWSQDWLVKRGYIIDDTPDVLKIEVTQQVDRKNQRVEIRLEAA